MSSDILKNDLLLFGDIHPDVYKLSTIYDPDLDFVLTSDTTFQSGVTYYTRTGTGDHVTYEAASVTVGAAIPLNTYYVEGDGPSEQSGKFVPAVNSLVVDDTIGNGVYVLYVVHSVNEDTLKTTLRPVRLVEEDDDAPNRIVGYGNDIYMLYYDTQDANSVDVRLRLDRKLVFYGKHPAFYQLVKIDSAGNRQIISRVLNGDNFATASAVPIVSVAAQAMIVTADNKSAIIGQTVQQVTHVVENNQLIATREEFVATNDNLVIGSTVYVLPEDLGLRNVLKGDWCYALNGTTLVDGKIVYLEVFEAEENLNQAPVYVKAMSIELTARHAHVLDHMDVSSTAIVDFVVDLNNAPADRELWFLEKGRSVTTLSYTPKLVFEDGTTESVPIDNVCCFAYGLNDVDSSLTGAEYTLLFKYYPAKNRTVNLTRRYNLSAQGFMYCEKTVKIIEGVRQSIAKISVIPFWNNTTQSYELKFYPYSIYQNRVNEITNVTDMQGSFDGTSKKFGVKQSITLQTNVIGEDGDMATYTQAVTLKLENYNNYTTKSPWLIADQSTYMDSGATGALNGPVFGVNSAPYKRPVLHYNSSTGMYYVSKDEFTSATRFIANFYRNANPPAYNADARAVYVDQNDREQVLMSESWAATDATRAPEPTHFLLRDLASGLEICAPQPITTQNDAFAYSNEFALATTGAANQYVNSTLLMEFYSGDDNVIYGVPVEVR